MFRRTLALAAMVSLAGGSARAVAQPAIERTSSTTRAALSVDVAPDEDAEEDTALEDGEPVFGVDVPLYDPGEHALAPLYRALRRAEAGEGQARILVYGASHVAADLFTGVIRERLQARFGDAGAGFVMPARPWRNYRHRAGMSIESSRRWDTRRVTASRRDIDALGHPGKAVSAHRRADWGRIEPR
jgi:hypothetical protein